MSVLMSPDCAVRKHAACTGDAWDEVADRIDSCFCPCHLIFRVVEEQP